MNSLPRSPVHQSLPAMCPRGSHTFLSAIRQRRAGAGDLMTLPSWNATRSSASSAAMARFSFRSPRRAHVGRSGAPAQIALRGSERAQNRDCRIPDVGARRGSSCHADCRARNLTGCTVESRGNLVAPAVLNGEAEATSRSKASAQLVCIPGRPEGGTMGFFQNSSARLTVRRRTAVFAVGRRVYVAALGERPTHVALTDDAGADARTRLADGTEVEVLAWRPRGSGDTRYRVRATRNGLEGWLAVDNLRGTQSAVSAPTEPPPSATGPEPLCAAES